MQKKNKTTDANNTNRKEVNKMTKSELQSHIKELEVQLLQEQRRNHIIMERNTNMERQLLDNQPTPTPTEKPYVLIINNRFVYEFTNRPDMVSWTKTHLASYTFVSKLELTAVIIVKLDNVKSKKTN